MSNDLEFIRRLAKGDSSTLDAIVDAHQDAVVRFARGITGDEASALDAAQEAFIRLWRNPRNFQGGSLRAWLLAVTRNIALNELRSRKRRTGRIQKVAEPPPPPTAVQQAVDAERLNNVREFVAALPEQERSALTLYAVEGMTQAEIASVLETTPGAIKQAILSARTKLRERFGEP